MDFEITSRYANVTPEEANEKKFSLVDLMGVQVSALAKANCEPRKLPDNAWRILHAVLAMSAVSLALSSVALIILLLK